MFMLGADAILKGDITSLNFVAARDPRALEQALGFAPGRLSQGYRICLLREQVMPGEVRLGGFTLSSGGREGLPADSWEADGQRRRIDDRVSQEYDDGGANLRSIAAAAINRLSGPQRTIKLVANIPHNEQMPPNVQYPPGLGAPQWTLLVPKRFLVALEVDAGGRAHAPGFDAAVGAAATLDQRMRVARYLETA